MGSARRRNPRCSHVGTPRPTPKRPYAVSRLARARSVPDRTGDAGELGGTSATNHPTCWSESSQVRPQVEY